MKSESKKPLPRICSRQAGPLTSQQTSIVSSPITSISFQQILISSLPRSSPKHLPLPHIIIETRQPEQVSISTSLTQPRRQPFFELITSLLRRSVIEQFILSPFLLYVQLMQMFHVAGAHRKIQVPAGLNFSAGAFGSGASFFEEVMRPYFPKPLGYKKIPVHFCTGSMLINYLPLKISSAMGGSITGC